MLKVMILSLDSGAQRKKVYGYDAWGRVNSLELSQAGGVGTIMRTMGYEKRGTRDSGRSL